MRSRIAHALWRIGRWCLKLAPRIHRATYVALMFGQLDRLRELEEDQSHG